MSGSSWAIVGLILVLAISAFVAVGEAGLWNSEWTLDHPAWDKFAR